MQLHGCAENYGIIQKALNAGWCSGKGSRRKSALSASLLSLWAYLSPPQPPQSRHGSQAPSSITGPEDLLRAQRGQPGGPDPDTCEGKCHILESAIGALVR